LRSRERSQAHCDRGTAKPQPPRQYGLSQVTRKSGSGDAGGGVDFSAGTVGRIATAGAAENSERNPRLFIPCLTNEGALRAYAAEAAWGSPDTPFTLPSTVNRTLCAIATKSAASATLAQCTCGSQHGVANFLSTLAV
jgi:hypothetical protein